MPRWGLSGIWNLMSMRKIKDKRLGKKQKELYIETYQEVKQSIDPLVYSPDDISYVLGIFNAKKMGINQS